MSEIVIVGGGVAGYSLALELASKGILSTIIEKKDLGGVCLNTGCIPIKMLLHLSTNNKNLKEIINKSNQTVSLLRNNIQKSIEEKKIKYIKDEAKIISENELFLKNSKKKIFFDKLIIATGSEANIPNQFKEIKDLITHKTFNSLEETPSKCIIIGGGYIGVEFATLLNNLGSKVTIIEKEKSILPYLCQDISNILKESFEKRGIKIFNNRIIKKIEENTLYLDNGNEISYDKIILATGMKPVYIDSSINLEKEGDLIKVNEYFQTSKDNIYLIGDVSGGPLLANKAEYDARLLAKNLLKEKLGLSNKEKKPNYINIPKCIFSDPPIGIIGSQNKRHKIIKVPFNVISKSYCDESVEGFIKIFIDEKQFIVGAQIINKNAIEILSILTVIINKKMKCEEVANIVFAHPTYAEIIKEVASRANLL